MNTRLYRSRTDAMIGGVCGGLGKYLGIDSIFVRLFFVLLALAGNGIGALIYFLLWIIVPLEGQSEDATLRETVRTGSEEIAGHARAVGEDLRNMVSRPHPQTGLVIGAALIILGTYFLLENLRFPWLRWLDFNVLWPTLLIIGGLALLLRRTRGG